MRGGIVILWPAWSNEPNQHKNSVKAFSLPIHPEIHSRIARHQVPIYRTVLPFILFRLAKSHGCVVLDTEGLAC
jgi:hypothetical protein